MFTHNEMDVILTLANTGLERKIKDIHKGSFHTVKEYFENKISNDSLIDCLRYDRDNLQKTEELRAKVVTALRTGSY